MEKKNYYDWLEISKNASPEVIDKAYKALVKKYHPDLQEGENKLKAEEIIKHINEAYAILSDEVKRKQYDETIKEETISREDYDRLQEELNTMKRQSATTNYQANYQNYNVNNNTNYNTNDNMFGYNNYLVLDSLFNIKYVVSLNELKHYDLISTNKISAYSESFYGMDYYNSYLYKNPYSLSLGYMVSNKIKENFECNNPFDCQNKIINNMTNTNNKVYYEQILDENFKLKDQDFYLLPIINNFNSDQNYQLCVNYKCFKLDDKINKSLFFENNFDSIEITKENINDIYLAYFNFDEFINKYNILKENQLNITSFKENHIKGNINVDDNNVLFLSIPYDDGFKILVDNKEVNYYKVIDNFIGLDLEKGYHDIEIIYEVKGFKLGLFVSLLSLITYILIRKHL